MRVKNHIHIRHIMLYHEKGLKAAQSFRDNNQLFGEKTISERQCREWFARFKSGDTSVMDNPGRGRPSDFDDQALDRNGANTLGPMLQIRTKETIF